MNTELLIKELSYSLPSDIIVKLGSSPSLSSQLNIIREWVQYNSEITHEERLKWHQPLLNIARKNSLNENEANSLTNIAKIYDRLGDFDKSLDSTKRVKSILKELTQKDEKYFYNLIIAYCDHAVTLRLQNSMDLALSCLHQGYEIFKNKCLDNKEVLIILFSDLGIIYREISDYPAALSLFSESLKLIEDAKNPDKYVQNKILCHINIGNVNKESEKRDLACENYSDAINIITESKNYFQYLIIANINLGQVLVDLKKYKKAIKVYDNAIKECIKSGGNMDLGFIYLSIAEAYLKSRDISKFDEFIIKGKGLVEDAGYPNDMLLLNTLLFNSYDLKGKINEGILFLLKSVDICKKHKMNQHLLRSYKALSEAYKKAKDIENAFLYSEKYIAQKDIVDKQLNNLFLNEKQQTLNRMQEEVNTMKEKQKQKILEVELQFKKRELISKKLHSLSNRDFLEDLNRSLKGISKLDLQMASVIKDCEKQILQTSSWTEFLDTYEQANPTFMKKIRHLSDTLSSTEIRVCSLIHLGLDNYEIASFMSVSKRSVEQHRYRIKKKLNIEQNLTEYLLSLN